MRFFQKKTGAVNLHPKFPLFSQTESRYDCTVSLDVHLFEIVEKTSSVTDHHKKTATAVVILRVIFKVFGEFCDTSGQKSDLNFG